MYFPALRKSIQSAEEKKFYDIALIFLDLQGYRELSIVDGAGDGGRDVICSRKDIRIQLSVRSDWKSKVNEEAAASLASGTPHLVYVTNRAISAQMEADFLASSFAYKGEVDLVIHDLNKLSTSLARPGNIRRAYEMMGLIPEKTITADPKEIAVSTVLLFSPEAKELHDSIIDATVMAWVYKNPGSADNVIIDEVSKITPGANVTRGVRSALSRLRTTGKIQGAQGAIRLSPDEGIRITAAETEYVSAFESDLEFLEIKLGVSKDTGRKLLDIAKELLVRRRGLEGDGMIEQDLRRELAVSGLQRRRQEVYSALSECSIAKLVQFGQVVDQVFATDTFDIYRALGRRTDLSMVLDSSVAMPMIFGLEFGIATSRYGVSASILKDVCREHGVKLVVPACYINEMASHGAKALDYLETYGALPSEARSILRASQNAYLSHFTHISETASANGNPLQLEEFLAHFGIAKGRGLQRIENRIASILDNQGILRLPDERYNNEIKKRIAEEKPNESSVIVNHDAVVCTMMQNNNENGYIFATWDRVMMDAVQDMARVYADTPARVIDFLSMAQGEIYDSKRNVELLSTLLHCDERPMEKLARKLGEIDNVEVPARLQQAVDEARQNKLPVRQAIFQALDAEIDLSELDITMSET